MGFEVTLRSIAMPRCVNSLFSCGCSCSQQKYANQLQDILQTIDHLGSHELYDKFLACLPQFSRTAQHSAHPAANERSTHYYYTCSKSAQVAFEDESIEPLPSSEYSCFGNDTASHYEQMAAYNLHKVCPVLCLFVVMTWL